MPCADEEGGSSSILFQDGCSDSEIVAIAVIERKKNAPLLPRRGAHFMGVDRVKMPGEERDLFLHRLFVNESIIQSRCAMIQQSDRRTGHARKPSHSVSSSTNPRCCLETLSNSNSRHLEKLEVSSLLLDKHQTFAR